MLDDGHKVVPEALTQDSGICNLSSTQQGPMDELDGCKLGAVAMPLLVVLMFTNWGNVGEWSTSVTFYDKGDEMFINDLFIPK